MSKTFDAVLLLALPASGKSEVRRYLAHLSPKACQDDFHMGPTVQLDDYPYVHMMRRVDDELAKLGRSRVFFHAPDKCFRETRDWGTLIHLVNEDYVDLVAKKALNPASAAEWLLARMDAAGEKAGIRPRLATLAPADRKALSQALEKEAKQLLKEKLENYPDSLEGKTLVMEFARGGPDKSSMPLPAPLGYRYSIGQVCPEILEKAVILYVWVAPEESRRKNQARTDPNDPGSILHHGVPLEVMLNDYGCDDMDWLEANSGTPGTVAVENNGRKFIVPIARFDNRVDKTSFLRADRKDWPADQVGAVHQGIKSALDRLAQAVAS